MTHTYLSKQIPPASKCLLMLPFEGINTEEKKCYKTQDCARDRVRVPRRDSYENPPVFSVTIHPDIKRTGMTVSQVADEVLYTGLIEMQELPDISE